MATYPLLNGDFETFTGTLPDSWTLVGAGATTAKDITAGHVHGGTSSLALTRVGTDCNLYQNLVTAARPLAWWIGRAVTITAWVRATASGRAQIAVDDGVTLVLSPYHSGSGLFERLTVTSTISPAVTRVHVYVGISAGDTTAQFDDVVVAQPATPNQRTVTQVLRDVRTNLDENAASFWTDAQLIAYIDQAYTLVWLEVKRVKADYFTVERTSLDGAVTILGESYDTSSFRLAAGTTRYTLPPDVAEIKLVECITSGYEQVVFTFRDLTHPNFQGLRQWTSSVDPTGFLVDLMGERTMVIAPTPNRALDLRLNYVPILDSLTTGTDTLQLPHPLWLAVVDLATKRAQMKDSNSNFLMWERDAQATVQRFLSSHSRQTQDPEYVQGLFE